MCTVKSDISTYFGHCYSHTTDHVGEKLIMFMVSEYCGMQYCMVLYIITPVTTLNRGNHCFYLSKLCTPKTSVRVMKCTLSPLLVGTVANTSFQLRKVLMVSPATHISLSLLSVHSAMAYSCSGELAWECSW